MELILLLLGSTSLLALVLLALTIVMSGKKTPKKVSGKIKSDLKKIKEQINKNE